MYLHAWKAGLKTTYYLRSRPATRITQTTTGAGGGGGEGAPTGNPPSGGGAPPDKPSYTDEEAIACSLENPEACEACD
jgi:ribonucleoside-diphosphate reductase alpha chain